MWPEPTADGVARLVKLVLDGTQPVALCQAHCGQWQNPLLYLPSRSTRSRFMVAPRYLPCGRGIPGLEFSSRVECRCSARELAGSAAPG